MKVILFNENVRLNVRFVGNTQRNQRKSVGDTHCNQRKSLWDTQRTHRKV